MSVSKYMISIRRDSVKFINKKHYILLHLNILIFSVTGIFSKFVAESINKYGIFHINTFIFFTLMLLNCAFYALFWQQNLKHFEVNVAYSHRAVYNIWSLLWAVLIFSEQLTLGNVLGTMMIICGILVMRNE